MEVFSLACNFNGKTKCLQGLKSFVFRPVSIYCIISKVLACSMAYKQSVSFFWIPCTFRVISCHCDLVIIIIATPLNVCAVRDLLGGASFVSLAGQHTFYGQNCDNQAAIYRLDLAFFLLNKHEPLWINKTSQCLFVSWGHHPVPTTNIFTSIWPMEDKREMWWPAKHSSERPA